MPSQSQRRGPIGELVVQLLLAGSPTPNIRGQIASGKHGCRFFNGINRFVDNLIVIVSSQSPRVMQESNKVRLCG